MNSGKRSYIFRRIKTIGGRRRRVGTRLRADVTDKCEMGSYTASSQTPLSAVGRS
jgi:hypothetical protein